MNGSILSRLVLLGGICMFTMGSQYSCSSGDGTLEVGDPGVGDDFTTSLTLRDTNGAERTTFGFGQAIVFELRITNDTAQTQKVALPTGQVFDFAVLNPQANSPRWLWSTNRAFTPSTFILEFAPQQTRTFSYTWNGVLDDGTQLMPGTYDARGTIAYAQYDGNWRKANDLATPITPFTITN